MYHSCKVCVRACVCVCVCVCVQRHLLLVSTYCVAFDVCFKSTNEGSPEDSNTHASTNIHACAHVHTQTHRHKHAHIHARTQVIANAATLKFARSKGHAQNL